MSESLEQRIEKLNQELASLKEERDKLYSEAKKWVEKRNSIHKKIKKLRTEATGLKEKRDILNEKVQELKRNVLNVLKHAANIRHLQPDEWIVVSIKGTPRPTDADSTDDQDQSQTGEVKTINEQRVIVKSGGSEREKAVQILTAAHENLGPPTFLTIRVKNSDVLTWAEGKLGFDEFSQKAAMFTY